MTTTTLNLSALAGYYQTLWNGTGTGVPAASTGTESTSSGTTTAATKLYAPTPPWSSGKEPTQSKLVTAALNGGNIVNPNAAQLDMPGANTAYKNLFAVYQGLDTLYALADQASGGNVSTYQLSQLSSAFESGLQQVEHFVGSSSFGSLRLTSGTTTASETTSVSTPAQSTAYDTVALNTSGNSAAVVPALEGDVEFNVTVTSVSGNQTVVPMDLDNMGSTPRTMTNVVAYLNSQMKAAGALTTFSVNSIAAQPDTISVGGNAVTVSSGQSGWGLQVNTNPYETVSFSAPQTDPAVYIGQVVGDQSSSFGPGGVVVPSDAQSQLLKLQAGGTATITAPSPGAHAASGQIFADSLGAAVNSVQATATASDGSVYVLADVNATAGGQAAPGGQDVALLKYDSAGNLVFQTDLGSASNASGLSLAVSPDGSQVAVAGQITGPLTAGQSLENPTAPNSFVAVFDSQGDQVWSQEDDGVSANQATGVAFGGNGTVYVTGRSAIGLSSTLSPQSASTGYLQGFSSTGVQISNTSFGSTGVNSGSGVAVVGSTVYVAGVQNGDAVVNEYDVSTPSAPTLVATRDLGNLGGGSVAGVSVQNGTVYVAGTTRNGNLTAGCVTSAFSGNSDAFAATLSAGLAPAASDAIAYYGGTGSVTVSAMTVNNGQVFVTGSATGALPGEPALGAEDGFAAELNVATGQTTWAQRFTGQDGQVAPTSIAVSGNGASVLDQLGLPQGVVNGPVSDLITATTNVKAADSFTVGTDSQDMTTITVSATDTMSSLAEKISRATGSQVSVNTVTTANGVALQIQPLDPYATVVLGDGPTGTDALSELGLKAGILDQTTTKGNVTVPADGKGQIYGLGLSASLSLTSAASIKSAMSQLTAAMSVIKNAYQTLKTAATPANVLALEKAQGAGNVGVPAYLSAQIANYQAALTRLTAGQTSTTTLGV